MNKIRNIKSKNNYWLSPAFTLIEIIVVISIMGILSSYFYSNYMEARKKTRDTQRKSDLKQIQKALEIYKQNQPLPIFPTPTGNPPYLSVTNNQWSETSTSVIYMNKVPADPLSSTVPTPYFYKSPRLGIDNSTFLLCACLENKADKEGSYCNDDPLCNFNCSSNWCYKVTEP